jgi:acyl-homoserine-lactone acylase
VRSRRIFSAVLLGFILDGLPTAAEGTLPRQDGDDLAREVEVIRTDYGVPHIYAENYRALGYALGYLQLEDYGRPVAIGMVRSRGELGRHQGPSAIESDLENRWHYLQTVERYQELSADTRDVYEGFAAGVNRYVALHPDEFPEWMTPDFTGYDVASLYMYRVPDNEVRRWRSRIERPPGRGGAFFTGDEDDNLSDRGNSGSSAWALAPDRTASGAAILMRNPHLSWDAGYWEVHVVVPGRLDFYGDFRIGGPLGIIGGFNRDIGFATTNNEVDTTEVYSLEVDPDQPDHYLLDGRSNPIHVDTVTIEYVDGNQMRSRSRDRLSTTVGPVIARTGDRIYVMKSAEDGELRAGEQFLRLIEAGNLEEWTGAMRMRAHPGSNFVYADREGNIFYIWYGAVPVRPHAAVEDEAILVSHTEDTWTRLHSLESLPQVLNPAGGYVRDENNGPWLVNLNAPIDPARYPDYFEVEEFSLRSQHATLLLHNEEILSLEDVVELKHNDRMLLAERVKDDLLSVLWPATEEGRIESTVETPVRAAMTVLSTWDNTASAESRGSVLFEEWWQTYSRMFAEDEAAFAEPWNRERPIETPRGLADPQRAVDAFGVAVGNVVRRHGSVNVAWGTVHRVRRGAVDEPVSGCAGDLGCFRVLNFSTGPNGTRQVDGGDGWVLAVEFTDPPRAYSVLGYGQSVKENSPHFADQARMFARGEMKPVAFTREEIDRRAIRRYRPGLE